MVSPQLKPNDRDRFWNDMQYKGMDYCINNYVEHYDDSFKEQIKSKIKKLSAKIKNSYTESNQNKESFGVLVRWTFISK